jgi:RNA polymerase sigma factor (sigma-70 family)
MTTEELYQEWGKYVKKMARYYCPTGGCVYDRSDLEQDAWVQILTHFDKIDFKKTDLRPWIKNSVKWAVMKRQRYQNAGIRKIPGEYFSKDEAGEIAFDFDRKVGFEYDIDSTMILNDLIDRARLTAGERAAIEHRYNSGQHPGCSKQSLSMDHIRALKKMKWAHDIDDFKLEY